MKRRLILRFLTFLMCSLLPSGYLSATVVNNAYDLIVPAGESYLVAGSTTYLHSIQIYGTLNVAAYTGGDITGRIEITASTGVVGASGLINAVAGGYAAASGPGAGLTATGNTVKGGGGGYGGNGGAGDVAGGASYGSLLTPSDFGSGGGNGYSSGALKTGGRGGGSIVLNFEGEFVHNGTISTSGGVGACSTYYGGGSGGGSGGTIRINAGSLSGSGTITSNGGNSCNGGNYGGAGAGGRIVINSSNNTFTGTVQARGGSGTNYGAAGTVLVNGALTVENNSHAGTTKIPGESLSMNELVIGTGVTMEVSSPIVVAQVLTVNSGSALVLGSELETGSATISGSVTPPQGNADMRLTVNGDLVLNSGAYITADSKGYLGGVGPGAGVSVSGANVKGGGGGHGGIGGAGDGAGGAGYDAVSLPVLLGSGGGNGYSNSVFQSGGRGGGVAVVQVGGTLTNNGTISSNGGNGSCNTYYGGGGGGGAGGSLVVAAATLAGNGVITANGGNSCTGANYGGGGAGGRITVAATVNNFSGTLQAIGGSGTNYGGAGTLVVDNILYINNNAHSGTTVLSGEMTLSSAAIANSSVIISSPMNVGYFEAGLGAAIDLRSQITGNTVQISSGAVLYPTTASASLSAANINIAQWGKITADALGYSAGTGPGKGVSSTANTNTGGSGAGYGGNGGNADYAGGGAYDSLSSPVEMGSGGGNGYSSGALQSGGRGGGIIRLAASGIVTVNGTISANGANGSTVGGSGGYGSGGGSGGAVVITAGGTDGNGVITANGGNGATLSGGGGGGRISITTANGNFEGTYSAYGGTGLNAGGAGTVSINGSLLVNNNGRVGTTQLPMDSLTLDDVLIGSGATVIVSSPMVVSNLLEVASGATLQLGAELESGSGDVNGTMTPPQNGTAFHLVVNGDLNINVGGAINANGKGYLPANGPGAGTSASGYSVNGGGAGHGGVGGAAHAAGGVSYDSFYLPIEMGSGGGNGYSYGTLQSGGAGGGLVRLDVSGNLLVDGSISANGNNGAVSNTYGGGGGAGGSLVISANSLSGAGTITANGGVGYGEGASGGGGGGLIKVSAANNSFTGAYSATGGTGINPGGAGIILVNAALNISNNNRIARTSLVTGEYQLSDISISSGAQVEIPADFTATCSTFTVNAATVTCGGRLTCSNVSLQSGVVYLDNTLNAADFSVGSGGILSHSSNTALFDLQVSNNLLLSSGAYISADGKGYPSATGPGKGVNVTANGYGTGGGHGGQGGAITVSVVGGTTYDSMSNPTELGSGGGSGEADGHLIDGGAGGGKLKINVANEFEVNGVVSADGKTASSGGAGGTIYIAAAKLLGNGAIHANGGSSVGGSGFPSGGGGGGGRVVLFMDQDNFSGVLSATGNGPADLRAGTSGSVMRNGVIVAATAPSSQSSQALTISSSSMGSNATFTANVRADTLQLSGLTVNGSLSGSMNFTSLKLVKLSGASFSGSGFAKGSWISTLNNTPYSGDFVGMVVQNSTGVFINGALGGGMIGTLEARLTEVVPGSQNYTVFAATASYKQLGTELVSGLLQISGSASYGQQENYTGVNFTFLQTSVSGQMQGFYSGTFNAVGSHARIASTGNPYDGEGFFDATYTINGKEARGYVYAKKTTNTTVSLKGMLDYPVYSLFEGTLGIGLQSVSMSFTNDKVMNPSQKLSINLIGPRNLSAGQSVAYKIDVLNKSTDQTVQGRTIQVVLPRVILFIAASRDSTFSKYFNTVRFRLPNLAPGDRYSADLQVKVKPGIGTLRLPIKLFTVNTATIDTIYAQVEAQIWPNLIIAE